MKCLSKKTGASLRPAPRGQLADDLRRFGAEGRQIPRPPPRGARGWRRKRNGGGAGRNPRLRALFCQSRGGPVGLGHPPHRWAGGGSGWNGQAGPSARGDFGGHDGKGGSQKGRRRAVLGGRPRGTSKGKQGTVGGGGGRLLGGAPRAARHDGPGRTPRTVAPAACSTSKPRGRSSRRSGLKPVGNTSAPGSDGTFIRPGHLFTADFAFGSYGIDLKAPGTRGGRRRGASFGHPRQR